MHSLEDLTLNGALNLLALLQQAQFNQTEVSAVAIAEVLVTLLQQLETVAPNGVPNQGWPPSGFQLPSHLARANTVQPLVQSKVLAQDSGC